MNNFKTPKKSIDSYILIFFHRVSPINLSEKKINKFIIQTTFSSKILQSSQINNKENKINKLNQNLIFPFNKKSMIQKNKDFEIIFGIKNLEENSDSNLIGKCSFNINNIIFSEFMKFPEFWLSFENLKIENEILGFMLISVVFVSKENIENLPYFWKNSGKDVKLEIGNIPCYLKINYEEFIFSFFNVEFLEKGKFKLIVKFKGQSFDNGFFEEQNICSKFSFPILKPFIDQNILILLVNGENEEIAEYLLNLEKFINMEHDAIFSLNMYNKNQTDLICRLNYEFKKNIEKDKKNPFLNVLPLEEEEILNLRENLEDTEKFSLILDLNFLSNFDFEHYIFFEVKWGGQKEEIKIDKKNSNFLEIGKRLIITEEFIFTQESFDFLPEPIICIKNEQKEILFIKNLDIEKINIMRENNIILNPECYKMRKFNDSKKQENNEFKKIDDFCFISFSSFIMDYSLGLEISNFLINEEKKKNYYVIDLISMKYQRQIEKENTEFAVLFKNDEKNYKIESKKLKPFNWIRKELLFKKDENIFLKKPFVFNLLIQNENSEIENFPLYFKKEENLDGIPQWLNFKKNIQILMSFRKFENKYDFENYIKSKKVDYYPKILKNVENNNIYEQKIFFEKCQYTIKLNLLKISDFEKKINTLKLKSPFLEIDLDCLNISNKNQIGSKRKIFPNLSNSLKNGICSNKIFLEEEMNFKFSLPIDSRILPCISIKLLEKEIEKTNKLKFSKISEKIKNLGESSIEIFDFYLKQQILLFRKLYHLEKILGEDKKIQYRDILMPILKSKLTKIEETLLFTKNLKTNFEENINSEEDDNLSQKTDLDRKKNNYFHFIKKIILERLDKNESTKLNYDIKKIIKSNSKKNIKRYSNHFSREDEIIFDSAKFKINPLKEKIDSKEIFLKKKIKNFKRIAFHDEKTAHYRYIIKTALEDSFYLDLNDFWNPLDIIKKENNYNKKNKTKINSIDKSMKSNKIKLFLDDREKFENKNPNINIQKKTNLISESYLENRNSEKSINIISQKEINNNNNFNVSSINSMGKIWTSFEMFNKDELFFYDQLLNLGLEPENLGLTKKKERVHELFEKLKLRLYLTKVFFEKDYDCKNLYVKIFLENIEISEMSLFNKKNKKENGFFFLEINECVEKLYNLGFSKSLKIIFVEKNKNFETIKEIAETFINLDQRYLNKNWQNLIHKPIETRILKAKDSDIYVGKLNLWLEIINKKNENHFPLIKISRFSVPEKYQVRVVLWNLEDLDNILDTSINSEQIQEIVVEGKLSLFPFKIKKEIFPEVQFTETYYVPKNEKKIKTNYRMIWNFDLNSYKNNLDSLIYLKIKNKTTNQIFERKIDFTQELTNSIKNKKKIILQKKNQNQNIKDIKFEAFPIKITNEIEIKSIKMKLRIEICDENSISKFETNIGRNEPNEYPCLIKPPFYLESGDQRRIKKFWVFYFISFFLGFIGVLLGCYVFSKKITL